MLRRQGSAAVARAIELATTLPLVTSLHVAMTGATVRNAYAGMGARNGIMAAEAVMAGVTADEGTFRDALTRGVSDNLDEDRLVGDLGRHWEATRGYIKLHACARWLHPALDAAAGLLPSGGMDPGLVEAVVVRTFRFAAMMNDPRPRTDLAGKFSVPYAIAALVAFGRVELEAFTPEALQRPDILDLASRVTLVDDPDYTAALPDRRPTSVSIRFRDGREVSATVDGSRGDPETAFSPEEIEAKFVRLAEASIGPERATRALELLRGIDRLPDARQLLDALTL
jgi:2-methylcitrate dehydratase PrpD